MAHVHFRWTGTKLLGMHDVGISELREPPTGGDSLYTCRGSGILRGPNQGRVATYPHNPIQLLCHSLADCHYVGSPVSSTHTQL